MALQSQLFTGDPQLEAAAIADNAHITPGANGPHVRKIQLALIQLDGASISADGAYGPATANAVLSFKQKRNIVNRAYQSAPDSIVGKMTIAALDSEVRRLEDNPELDDRGRIHCQRFPLPVVRSTSAAVRFAISGSAVTAPAPVTPKSEAIGRVPNAVKWVEAALRFIQLRRAQLLSGLPSAQFQATEEFKALETHFKLNSDPKPLDLLALLERVYTRIALTLAMADDIFIDDPATRDFANAFVGGFHEPNHPQHGKIRFGPPYAGKGELFQTSVLVHEGAHFVDHSIGHFASELPAPNGTPVDSTKNYVQLTSAEAARNAYTYAQFALHALKGFDKRIVPFNE